MTKREWRTLSIRHNPQTRKAIALQGQFPITTEEWNTFMTKLAELRSELVEQETP